MSSPPNLSNLTSYEIVTGRRKGSILYKSNSFLYTKVKATPTTISLICQLRESLGCSASASIKTATNILQELRPHNHEPDAHDYELLVLKNRLKEEASKSPASNREIFNATSRQFPLEVASRVSFPQVVRQMSRRKLGTYPRIPGSISEFVDLLEENSNLRINFQSHILEDNEVVSTLFFQQEQRKISQTLTMYVMMGHFLLCQKYLRSYLLFLCELKQDSSQYFLF